MSHERNQTLVDGEQEFAIEFLPADPLHQLLRNLQRYRWLRRDRKRKRLAKSISGSAREQRQRFGRDARLHHTLPQLLRSRRIALRG